MIQPYVDFTGRMTPQEIEARNHEAMIQELNRLTGQSNALASMEIAAFGNVDNRPLSDNRPIPATIATIPHNLGYVPLFLVYKSNGQTIETTYNKLPIFFQSIVTLLGPTPGRVDYVLEAYADTQNLYIDILPGLATLYSGLLSFRYYIFSQPNQ